MPAPSLAQTATATQTRTPTATRTFTIASPPQFAIYRANIGMVSPFAAQQTVLASSWQQLWHIRANPRWGQRRCQGGADTGESCVTGATCDTSLCEAEDRIVFTRWTVPIAPSGYASDSAPVGYDGTELCVCRVSDCPGTLKVIVAANAQELNAGGSWEQTGNFVYYTSTQHGWSREAHVNVVSVTLRTPVAVGTRTPGGITDPDVESPQAGADFKMLVTKLAGEPRGLEICGRASHAPCTPLPTPALPNGGNTGGPIPIGQYDARLCPLNQCVLAQQLDWRANNTTVVWHTIWLSLAPVGTQVDLTAIAEAALGLPYGTYFDMLPDPSNDSSRWIFNHIEPRYDLWGVWTAAMDGSDRRQVGLARSIVYSHANWIPQPTPTGTLVPGWGSGEDAEFLVAGEARAETVTQVLAGRAGAPPTGTRSRTPTSTRTSTRNDTPTSVPTRTRGGGTEREVVPPALTPTAASTRAAPRTPSRTVTKTATNTPMPTSTSTVTATDTPVRTPTVRRPPTLRPRSGR